MRENDTQSPLTQAFLADCQVPPPRWACGIEEYHLSTSISASQLKRFREKPREFRELVAGSILGDSIAMARRVEGLLKKPAPHFIVGRAFGDYFMDRRAYRRDVAQLDVKDQRLVLGMIAAVEEADSGASMTADGSSGQTWAAQLRRVLMTSAGRSEYPIRWRHGSGLWLRARPDRLVGLPGRRLLNGEVKTSAGTCPDDFRRDIKRFEYYNQAALYEDGIRAEFPDWEVSTRWHFISKVWPHRVWCCTPDPDKLEDARRRNERDIVDIVRMLEAPGGWTPSREPWELANGQPEHG